MKPTEEISYSEALDADMKSSLLMVRQFCRVHKCSRYSSKFCAWCLDHHRDIETDYDHQINRAVIERILHDTEMPGTGDAGEEK